MGSENDNKHSKDRSNVCNEFLVEYTCNFTNYEIQTQDFSPSHSVAAYHLRCKLNFTLIILIICIPNAWVLSQWNNLPDTAVHSGIEMSTGTLTAHYMLCCKIFQNC